MDADHDDDLVVRYRRMEDLLGGGEPPGLAALELERGGHAVRTPSHRTQIGVKTYGRHIT